MTPYRTALGPALLSIVFLGTGILAILSPGQSPLFRFFAMPVGIGLLLMGVVSSILSVQVRAGRHEEGEPHGLRLGWKTLRVGALLLAVGVLAPIPSILHLGWPVMSVLAWHLSPIMVALGIVLLRNSAVALHREDSDSPGILTLGRVTFRTGLVLCVMIPFAMGMLALGLVFPSLLWKFGFSLIFLVMDCVTGGLALLIFGALLQADERSTPAIP